MKRVAILVMAIFMMSVSVPVFAAEVTKEQKDECMLASKGCKDQADSIQQKIKKLQAEIKKGKKVYSAEDLKKLNDKLKDTEDFLDNIVKGK
jgi:chaperonin cofactor prefoldin